jgi:hypothetical protein
MKDCSYINPDCEVVQIGIKAEMLAASTESWGEEDLFNYEG